MTTRHSHRRSPTLSPKLTAGFLHLLNFLKTAAEQMILKVHTKHQADFLQRDNTDKLVAWCQPYSYRGLNCADLYTICLAFGQAAICPSWEPDTVSPPRLRWSISLQTLNLQRATISLPCPLSSPADEFLPSLENGGDAKTRKVLKHWINCSCCGLSCRNTGARTQELCYSSKRFLCSVSTGLLALLS